MTRALASILLAASLLAADPAGSRAYAQRAEQPQGAGAVDEEEGEAEPSEEPAPQQTPQPVPQQTPQPALRQTPQPALRQTPQPAPRQTPQPAPGGPTRAAPAPTPAGRPGAPAAPSPGALPRQAPARTAAPSGGPGRQITMDFNDADLQVLVKFISELTGKNFILDEKVRGKVTIISPSRITVEEAYRVFEAVLDVKGFTTVRVGAALKIIPAREAKQTGIPVTSPDRPLPERAAGYITRIVPLQHIAAQDLVPVLTPLVSKDGSLLASQATNTLIITDAADNLDRILAIIQQLDVAGFQDRYEVIQLSFAGAKELAATLSQLVVQQRVPARGRAPVPGGVGQPGVVEGARIIPDERTNSLILQATSTDLEQLRGLIAQLDRPVPRAAGRINVIYLQHADAEEVAKVLAQLAPSPGAGRAAAGGGPPPRPPVPAAAPAIGGTVPGGPVGAAVAAAAPAGGGPAIAAELEGGVKITADKATNSLIVTAAPTDFEAIRTVVQQLDIRRPQVFVEALIMEVTLNRKKEAGVQGFGVGKVGSASLIGGTQTGANPFVLPFNPVLPFAPGLATAGGGAFGRPITITNPATGEPITFPSFTALIRFLNTITDVNVLSAPHLLTTNNKEAEIVVAQNIPFITSQTSDITQPTAVRTTVDRRDVGITLRLTPTINEGDLVRLDIFQEISDVAPSPQGLDPNQVGITTTKRSAKTSVLVQDDATIIIGGLIRDNLNDTENKIPLLGDIPLLGYLFKTTTRSVDKTNLLIFLTPHIVRSPEEIAEITQRREEQFRRWKERYNVREHDASGWIFDPAERARRGGIRDGFAVNEPIPEFSLRARPRAPLGPVTPPAEPVPGAPGPPPEPGHPAPGGDAAPVRPAPQSGGAAAEWTPVEAPAAPAPGAAP